MSEQTPVKKGRCVYCATTRAVGKPICPTCGRPWIDTMVDEELPPITPGIVAAALEERKAAITTEMPPPPDARPPRAWGLLLGIALGLIIIFVLFRVAFGGSDEEDAATTTSSVPETTQAATSTTSTTAATTTSTTTATTTSSTTSTTTATTTTTTLPPIEAVGDPVPVGDLTLGAFALGPFRFDADTSYLGRLVASLGQPDSWAAVGTDAGLCEGEEGAAYTWGGFTAIFRVEGDTERLVGYRLVDTGGDEPTQQIKTLSGLAIGDTIERLNAIYFESGIEFADIEGRTHFILVRSSDGATLLWGPVSGTDSGGIVEGIYSPRACDRGPTATP